MISVDAAQALIADKATVRQVTLVRVRTYSNVLTATLDATHYWATAPVLYPWTAGSPVQFDPIIKQVSAVVRGFPHIPDGVTLPTRDGIRIEVDGRARGPGSGWATWQGQNWNGALIDVATVLVNETQFALPTWADLSSLGSVHVVRWRGAVSAVSDWNWETGTFTLACDTVEPVLAWPVARDNLKNDPRDSGKRYPLPVGTARRVDLVAREVGHATTLASEAPATGTAAWSITDGAGFPTSGTFTVRAGDELVTVNGATSTNESLVITARAQLGTTAAKHPRGATIVEYVREARFVASARECRGLASLSWLLPSGQRLRLEPGTFGWNPAAAEIEPGQTLGVVSFAREQLAAALDVAAAVIQQAELGSTGILTLKLFLNSFGAVTDGTASVGPAVFSDATAIADNPAGVRLNYNSGGNDFVGVGWATVVENSTAIVIRIRPVFDIRVESAGTAAQATRVYYEVDSHTVGGSVIFDGKTLLISQSGTLETRQVLAGDWITPTNPNVFTVADLVGSSVSAGLRVAWYLDQTPGGAGSTTTEAFVYTTSSYWEVEIEPPPIVTTLPVDVASAWAVGNGLRLVADCLGVVERAGEAAVAALDFSTVTGWTQTNCTISVQTIGGRVGIRLASPTSISCDLIRTGLAENWSAAGGTISFEVYITAAFKDKLLHATGRYVEMKIGTNATDRYAYPFSPGDLIDDGWTTLVADLAYHTSRVTLGAGATLSNITRFELGPEWDSTSGAPQIHFRNVRFMTRAILEHPVDVGRYVVENLAGIVAGVDAAAATTAKANLPSVLVGGDLRELGDGLADILAALGFESRTNWIPIEGTTATLYRPLAASSVYDFPATARTLTLFRGLSTETRALDEIATEFSALWDYRPDTANEMGVEAYKQLSRADTTQNDIEADVSTASITSAQQQAGVRPALPQTFRLLGDVASLVEVWAYYVKESLRFPGINGRRWSMVVDFVEAWDLEPGDTVGFVTPWDGNTVKGRITRIAFPPDAPGIGLSLEQVT